MLDRLAVRLVIAQQAPNGNPKPPGELGQKMNDMVSYAKWVAFGVCVLAMIGAACGMAIEHRRGGDGQHVGGIVKVCSAVAIISASAALVGLFI